MNNKNSIDEKTYESARELFTAETGHEKGDSQLNCGLFIFAGL
jgi:hypothetical protein